MNFKKNNRIVSIGNGFSLWGFVFSWGWLLARGIWVFGIIFMIIEIPLGFYAFAGNAAFGSVSNNTFNFQHSYLLIPSILLFIIHIYIGVKGNVWLEHKLTQKGFTKYP